MRQLAVVFALGLTVLSCGTSTPEEQFIAQHQDALGVFTTTHGVLTMPANQLPANLSFEKVRAFYPVVCLDLDSDHDGIPDSFDLHFNGSPSSINPSALPHPCKRCNRGPGVNGDFRLHVMGTTVDLQRGRVSALDTSTLTIPGPDGAITVNFTGATEIKDGPVGPGAEVRVRGTMTATNTIAADLIWVLCPGAQMDIPGGGAGGGSGSTGAGGGDGSTATGGGDANPGTGGGIVEGGGPGGTGGSIGGTGGGSGSTGGSSGSSGSGTPTLDPNGRIDPSSLPPNLTPLPGTDNSGTPPLL